MVDAWLHGLLVQTLALSLAAAAARVLQATALRRLGAAAAYLCWLLVPVTMAAVALPHPAVDALVVHVDLAAIAPAWIAAAPVDDATRGGMAGQWVVGAWLAGALTLAATLGLRQRRFEALVTASTGDAVPQLPAGAGPAVLGVWRRRIVLPRDFDSAFDADERRLMLLHEGVHLRRGDNLWNLLASALLVAHWFNPIAWWAWRRMRADQETSCDAAVLREDSTGALATYAAALLKVQGVALTPPLATAWQSTHPLVERVRMLQHHRISSTRHIAGLRVAALAILVAGFGGYALQAGAGALPAVSNDDVSVMTAIDITQTTVRATAPDVANKTSIESNIRVLSRMGEQARIRIGDDKSGLQPFELGVTVSRLDGDHLQIDARLSAGAPLALLGSPRLVVRDGETGRVAIDTGHAAGAFTIALTPKVVAASSVDAIAAGGAPAPALPSPPPVSALPSPPPVPATNALPPLPAVPPQRAL